MKTTFIVKSLSTLNNKKLVLCEKSIKVENIFLHKTNAEDSIYVGKCIEKPIESMIIGENHIAYMSNYCWRVIGAIDPANDFLKDGDLVKEDRIEGFMFGGGEDQMGYFIINQE